jgi:hypothetical protein
MKINSKPQFKPWHRSNNYMEMLFRIPSTNGHPYSLATPGLSTEKHQLTEIVGDLYLDLIISQSLALLQASLNFGISTSQRSITQVQWLRYLERF